MSNISFMLLAYEICLSQFGLWRVNKSISKLAYVGLELAYVEMKLAYERR